MYACCEDAIHQTHYPDADFQCVADRQAWTCPTVFAHEVAAAQAQARADGEDDENWARPPEPNQPPAMSS